MASSNDSDNPSDVHMNDTGDSNYALLLRDFEKSQAELAECKNLVEAGVTQLKQMTELGHSDNELIIKLQAQTRVLAESNEELVSENQEMSDIFEQRSREIDQLIAEDDLKAVSIKTLDKDMATLIRENAVLKIKVTGLKERISAKNIEGGRYSDHRYDELKTKLNRANQVLKTHNSAVMKYEKKAGKFRAEIGKLHDKVRQLEDEIAEAKEINKASKTNTALALKLQERTKKACVEGTLDATARVHEMEKTTGNLNDVVRKMAEELAEAKHDSNIINKQVKDTEKINNNVIKLKTEEIIKLEKINSRLNQAAFNFGIAKKTLLSKNTNLEKQLHQLNDLLKECEAKLKITKTSNIHLGADQTNILQLKNELHDVKQFNAQLKKTVAENQKIITQHENKYNKLNRIHNETLITWNNNKITANNNNKTLDNATQLLKKYEAELKKTKESNTRLEANQENISNLKNDLNNTNNRIKQLNNIIADNQKNTTKQNTSYNKIVGDWNAQKLKLEAANSNCALEVQNLKNNITALKTQHNDANDQYKAINAQLKTEIENFKRRLVMGNNQLSNSVKIRINTEMNLSKSNSKITELETIITNYKYQITGFKKTITELNKVISKTPEDLKKKETECQEKLKDCQKKLKEALTKITKLENELNTEKNTVTKLMTAAAKHVVDIKQCRDTLANVKNDGIIKDNTIKQQAAEALKSAAEAKKELAKLNKALQDITLLKQAALLLKTKAEIANSPVNKTVQRVLQNISKETQSQIDPFITRAANIFLEPSGMDSALAKKLSGFKADLISKGINLLLYFASLSRSLIIAFYWLIKSMEDASQGYSWRSMDWNLYDGMSVAMNIEKEDFNKIKKTVDEKLGELLTSIKINDTKEYNIAEDKVKKLISVHAKETSQKIRGVWNSLKILNNDLNGAIQLLQKFGQNFSLLKTENKENLNNEFFMSIKFIETRLEQLIKDSKLFIELKKKFIAIFDAVNNISVALNRLKFIITTGKERGSLNFLVNKNEALKLWFTRNVPFIIKIETLFKDWVRFFDSAVKHRANHDAKIAELIQIKKTADVIKELDLLLVDWQPGSPEPIKFGGSRTKAVVNSSEDPFDLVDELRKEAGVQLGKIRDIVRENDEIGATQTLFRKQLIRYDKNLNKAENIDFSEIIRLVLEYLNTIRPKLGGLEESSVWWQKEPLQSLFPRESIRMAIFLEFASSLFNRINYRIIIKNERINYRSDPSSVMSKVEDIAMAYSSSLNLKNVLFFGGKGTDNTVLLAEEIRTAINSITKTMPSGQTWFINNQDKMFVNLIAAVWSFGIFLEKLKTSIKIEGFDKLAAHTLLEDSITGSGTFLLGKEAVDIFSKKIGHALTTNEEISTTISQLFQLLKTFLEPKSKEDMAQLDSNITTVFNKLNQYNIGETTLAGALDFLKKTRDLFINVSAKGSDAAATSMSSATPMDITSTTSKDINLLKLQLKNALLEINSLRSENSKSQAVVNNVTTLVSEKFDDKLKQNFKEAFANKSVVRHIVFLVEPLLEYPRRPGIIKERVDIIDLSTERLLEITRMFSSLITTNLKGTMYLNVAIASSSQNPVYLNRIQMIPINDQHALYKQFATAGRNPKLKFHIDEIIDKGGTVYVMGAYYDATSNGIWTQISSSITGKQPRDGPFNSNPYSTRTPIYLTNDNNIHVSFESENRVFNRNVSQDGLQWNFPFEINNNSGSNKKAQLLEIPFRIKESVISNKATTGIMFVITEAVNSTRDDTNTVTVYTRKLTHFMFIVGKI